MKHQLVFGVGLAAIACLLGACGGGSASSSLPPIGAAGNTGGSANLNLPVVSGASSTAASSGTSGSSTTPASSPSASASTAATSSSTPSASPSASASASATPTSNVSLGSIALPAGASGACSGTNPLTFTTVGVSASAPVSDPGVFGVFTVSSSEPLVATGSFSTGNLLIKALGAGATIITIADGAGNLATCSVAVNVAGPTPAPGPTLGAPSITGTGSGACSSTLALSGVGTIARIAISETGYTGAYAVQNTTSSVANASVTGSVLTVTTVATGSAVLFVADSNSKTATCPITVNSSQQSEARRL